MPTARTAPAARFSSMKFDLFTLGRVVLVVLALASALPLGGCSAFSGRSDDVGAALYRAEPDIRVRVRKNVQSITIDGPASVALVAKGDAAPVTLRPPVTITSQGRGLVATAESGEPKEFAPGQIIEVLPPSSGVAGDSARDADASPGAFSVELKLDGTAIPGTLLIRPGTSASSLDVIAQMGIETYLPGVVVGEMWGSWPLGSFQCQAVAARTYALVERDRARKAAQFFDVESTTADQVYTGSTKNPVANEAARSTRGMVVTEKGVLLKTYYSSTCGGRPGSASDVWPTGAGYEVNRVSALQGMAREPYCQASPFYRWELMRSDEDIKARMRAWGVENGHAVREIGRLRAANVSKRNKALRPSEFKLIDDQGRTFAIGAEQLRSACNFPVEGLDSITRETRVPSGDVEVTHWADQVKFKGQGFGHGVGMCQWCAKGYAERGITWQEMLRRFYPGTKIVKGY
jgi:stage II sporulation protein D